MKKYCCFLVVLLLIACLGPAARGQDVGFSQFYDQPLLRNPALAGIFTGDVRFVASYRNQWQSVTIPYRTFGLSTEVKLPAGFVADDNLTLGLQLVKDVAGTSNFSTVHIMPAVNYSLPLSEETNSYLSIGFMVGLMQQRFDPTKLVLGDQFIAGANGTFSVLPASRQVFNNTSVNYFDLSAGISYSGGVRDEINYFVGAGMFHITKPEVGFFEGNKITLNKKLAVNMGFSAPTSETDQFILYADYFRQFADGFRAVGSTFQAGCMFSHDLFVLGDVQKAITFGALYRLDDAIIPVVRLQVSKCTIGASYDINISKLVVASHYRGGFELTLSYRDFLNYNNSERRQVRCLKF